MKTKNLGISQSRKGGTGSVWSNWTWLNSWVLQESDFRNCFKICTWIRYMFFIFHAVTVYVFACACVFEQQRSHEHKDPHCTQVWLMFLLPCKWAFYLTELFLSKSLQHWERKQIPGNKVGEWICCIPSSVLDCEKQTTAIRNCSDRTQGTDIPSFLTTPAQLKLIYCSSWHHLKFGLK